jgi:hypothetical protein
VIREDAPPSADPAHRGCGTSELDGGLRVGRLGNAQTAGSRDTPGPYITLTRNVLGDGSVLGDVSRETSWGTLPSTTSQVHHLTLRPHSACVHGDRKNCRADGPRVALLLLVAAEMTRLSRTPATIATTQFDTPQARRIPGGPAWPEEIAGRSARRVHSRSRLEGRSGRKVGRPEPLEGALCRPSAVSCTGSMDSNARSSSQVARTVAGLEKQRTCSAMDSGAKAFRPPWRRPWRRLSLATTPADARMSRVPGPRHGNPICIARRQWINPASPRARDARWMERSEPGPAYRGSRSRQPVTRTTTPSNVWS